ncbi:MAG TPA: metallopeptidase family protein [bacterium]|nr:metallopeptidase family protein [bacterium]
MEKERIEELWEEVWTLLEDGKSDEGAAAALRALGEDDEVPEFRYLLGLCLLDLDEVEAALPELERAVEAAPDWGVARSALAWAWFRLCRFDEAKEQCARAVELDPELAETYQLDALLAERDGDEDRALVSFAEARRLDPDRFPDPCQMHDDEFLRVAQKVIDDLDPDIRRTLDGAPFFVQPFPAEELLTSEDPPLDPQLLGLFVGRSLMDQSVQHSGALRNTLYLFQRNLERSVTTRAELEEEIRITVLHEIGHHLGWGEEDLAERGLA